MDNEVKTLTEEQQSEQQHQTIWLQPWCDGCDTYANYGEGRHWCQDDIFEDCGECGRKPVKYTLAKE